MLICMHNALVIFPLMKHSSICFNTNTWIYCFVWSDYTVCLIEGNREHEKTGAEAIENSECVIRPDDEIRKWQLQLVSLHFLAYLSLCGIMVRVLNIRLLWLFSNKKVFWYQLFPFCLPLSLFPAASFPDDVQVKAKALLFSFLMYKYFHLVSQHPLNISKNEGKHLSWTGDRWPFLDRKEHSQNKPINIKSVLFDQTKVHLIHLVSHSSQWDALESHTNVA